MLRAPHAARRRAAVLLGVGAQRAEDLLVAAGGRAGRPAEPLVRGAHRAERALDGAGRRIRRSARVAQVTRARRAALVALVGAQALEDLLNAPGAVLPGDQPSGPQGIAPGP